MSLLLVIAGDLRRADDPPYVVALDAPAAEVCDARGWVVDIEPWRGRRSRDEIAPDPAFGA